MRSYHDTKQFERLDHYLWKLIGSTGASGPNARPATPASVSPSFPNGLTATADLAALQQICDRLGPGVINVFVQRWLALLPQPFTDVLRALIADNLDLGRPHNVEIIFNRRIRRDTQGTSAPTLLNGLFIETPLAA